MTSNNIWPPEDRPLTIDDYDRLQDDGYRYELVDGLLQVSPAPRGDHARAASRIGILLELQCPNDVEVFHRVRVPLDDHNLRCPDAAVIHSWSAPPLLVVEVASGCTVRLDRTTKKREYERFGIESYWIVVPDAEQPSLTAFELQEGRYEQVAMVAGDEEFRATKPFPVTIVPSLLVAGGNAWKDELR